MEANLCNKEASAANDCTDTDRFKRDYHPLDAQSPSLARHVRATPDCNLSCNQISENIEVGCLYEIDHTNLPPRSPIQLKSIRAVMVTEKTELNVSVRFPSILSLRTYFSKAAVNESVDVARKVGSDLAGKMQPELDEQFVMGLKLARQILTRPIPSSEIEKQKHLRSFWLVAPKVTELSTSVGKERSGNDPLVKGICWSALKCEGLVNWGVRRRVTFIGRHKENIPPLSWPSAREEEEEEGKPTRTEFETKKKNGKSRRDLSSRILKAKAAKKHGKEKPGTNKTNQQKLKESKDRWSAERYKLAEQKLLDIMKAKGAVFGHPILRPALRLEARKHIGDTGLLDHLLKHMAGKVAPGGTERFRRRHNADGAMEYWLENADLVNIRNEAGVHDPYWTPPSGWKPGDSTSQDPVCSRELKLLKEEMADIKRDVQELTSKKQEVDEANAAPKSSDNNPKLESAASSISLQEMYNNLVKRKAQLEQQLEEISISLNGMKEEMERLTSSVEETAKSAMQVEIKGAAATATADAAAAEEKKKRVKEEEEEEEEEAAKAAKRQRLCSGFRICKPQGTFLWPNMGGSAATNNNISSLRPQVVVLQEEDLQVVPTPSSAYSATSVPHLLSPPQGPHRHPTRPLAERRPVSVTVSSVVVPESACQGDNISTSLNLNDVSYGAGKNDEAVRGYDHDAAFGISSVTKRTDSMQCHRQHQGCSSSVGAWLALATPNPYLDDPNRG